MPSIEIEFKNIALAQALCGEQQKNIRLIENALNVEIMVRGNLLQISGSDEAITQAEKLLTNLYAIAKETKTIDSFHIETALQSIILGKPINTESMHSQKPLKHAKLKIKPKTKNQQEYLQAALENDLIFSIGPAGTGKTFLAMAMAIDALLRAEVKRVVLVRPAVEAGERLGFLPGDIAEKVNPYLRPLFDALYDMVDLNRAQRWLSQGVIELAPLAFMRGRTLNQSFVILDEAQNATKEQMKMFLTRLGYESKAIVTGDLSQSDLPPGVPSGLAHAVNILDGLESIKIVRFNDRDIVRHPLVQRIVLAYEREEKVASQRLENDKAT